jgi:hypothetical protein
MFFFAKQFTGSLSSMKTERDSAAELLIEPIAIQVHNQALNSELPSQHFNIDRY